MSASRVKSPIAVAPGAADGFDCHEPATPASSDDDGTASVLSADGRVSAPAAAAVAPTHQRPRRRWFQWVPSDRQQLAETEACLLHHLKSRYLQRFVAGINTVSSIPAAPAAAGPAAVGAATATTPAPVAARSAVPQRHVVLLHGFGGGLAMFMPNFDFLVAEAAKQPSGEVIQVHMLDLPGFARSDRHPLMSFANDREAMDYMCGHLREWFKVMGLDRPLRGTGPTGPRPHIDIVGHSFGAYVSATFALRYPQLAQRVVLCDPWGVPPKPENIEKEMPLKYRVALTGFYTGNPFSVLRAAGPWGPTLLPSVRKDFADRWEPIVGDATVFFDYVYHCNASAHPTGEQAFQACCTGPIFARRPQACFVPTLPASVGLGIIYGRRTWMDTGAGIAMMAEAAERRGPRSQNDHAFVEHAGHQVNTDNIEGFNVALARMLRLHGY